MLNAYLLSRRGNRGRRSTIIRYQHSSSISFLDLLRIFSRHVSTFSRNFFFNNDNFNIFFSTFFAATATLRTTRGNPLVSPSVRLFQLFCHLLKNSSGNPHLKICDLTKFFFEDTPIKKNCFTLSHSTFGKPSTKYFFVLIKKKLLHPLVEITFRYH